MTERKNIPAVTAARAMTAQPEERGSLVARGIAAILANNKQALTMDNDVFHRQGRKKLLTSDQLNGLIPILTKLFNALCVLGHHKFKDGAQRILYMTKVKFGTTLSEVITIELLKAAYLDLDESNKIPGVDYSHEIAVVKSKDELEIENAELWCILGDMYKEGDLVEQNNEQSVFWFRKAAEAGDADGQFNLGAMYDNGTGVSRKKAQAITWYQFAAAQGHVEAQNLLKLHDEETQAFTKIF